MKYKVLIISILSSIFAISAQENLEIQAEKFYEQKDYIQAAQVYETLMKKGSSADLYYNYANTQFKLNNLGKAILFYERALVLSPSDKDIQASLNFANTLTTDKIEGYQVFFIADWLASLGKLLNTNGWAYLSISLFVLTIILVLIYLFSSILRLRKAAFYISVLALGLSLIAFIYAFSQRKYLADNPYSIVMDGSVSIKASPSVTGKELFILHEGTKVKVLSQKNGWCEVEIADRRIGWVNSENIEKI